MFFSEIKIVLRCAFVLAHTGCLKSLFTWQELAYRRILSAPLILKPDLESNAELEGSDPSFLGWIDIATIFGAFLQGKATCADHAIFILLVAANWIIRWPAC